MSIYQNNSHLSEVGLTCQEEWKRKHRKRKTFPEKVCRICGKQWTPKTSQASRLRAHCYDYNCEFFIERERSKKQSKRK